MQRYYEYNDAEGKRWGAMQNFVGLSRKVANEQLSHLATVQGWTNVEVFKESMPPWEIKQRINAIQKENGNDPLHEEHELKPPELRKTIILVDHHDGSKIEVEQPILPTLPITVTNPAITAPFMPITDHADARPQVQPPAIQTIQSPVPAPATQTITSTVPAGGAQG